MRQDISGWWVRLTDEKIRDYTGSGRWSGRTVPGSAKELATRDPSCDILWDGDRWFQAGFLYDAAVRLAGNLVARGLRPGEVVSFQLPNWHEGAIVALAAEMCGLVVNPIVPIFRDSEVAFMLRDSHSRCHIIPREFRRFDYAAMMTRIAPDLPDLRDVVVVRGDAGDFTPFDALLVPVAAPPSLPSPDPDAVKLVMYTSGTTGRPKGVLHSHNTIRAELDALGAYWHLTERDVLFMPSPISHITGYVLALNLPWTVGLKAALMEVWNADRAIDLIRDQECSFTVGATPFLRELTQAALARRERLPGLRLFVCGGASVPSEVVRQAEAAFERCVIARVYGSTEAPTVTLGIPSAAMADLGATTDGQIAGAEVRIVDAATGSPMPAGEEGEIVVRGPELFLGYTRVEDNDDAFDEDGFFRTGDLGCLVNGDFIAVTGRKKDLIIRGGENISPREIEDVLVRHPDIAEVAVVAMPHPRMGEAVCACVIARPGPPPDLNALTRFIEAAGMARQKFPERLELFEDFPRTASGKVQKNVLRQKVEARVAEQG